MDDKRKTLIIGTSGHNKNPSKYDYFSQLDIFCAVSILVQSSPSRMKLLLIT